MMGSPDSEQGRDDSGGPQRLVTIARPFAVGRYEVTRDAYAAFVAATGNGSQEIDTCYIESETRRANWDLRKDPWLAHAGV